MRDPQESFDKYKDYELKLAESESAFRALEDLTKTKLAEGDPREGTAKDRETACLTSSGYLGHLEVLKTARAQYLKDRAHMNVWQGQHFIDKLKWR